MDVAPLLELMTEEATAKREAVLVRAREDAEAIRAEARSRAAARRQEAVDALRAELDAQAKRDRERAEASAQMVAQATKEMVAEEVLGATAEALQRLTEQPAFEPVLEKLLGELLEGAPEGVVVLVPAGYEDKVFTWLTGRGKAHWKVEVDPQLSDGVALRDVNGRFRVSNTLRLRLNKVETAARSVCMAVLFGKGA
jgi:V/A-type H+-transporting ATPase subunit E